MGADLTKIRKVLVETVDRAHEDGYSGYSKFDGLLSPVTRFLSFGLWPLRLVWSQLVMRAPVNLRPVLLVEQGVNPESPALFARACLDLATSGGGDFYRERARGCLDWLLQNESTDRNNFHGRCWGYHHPWQNTGFHQPAGYPNGYITVIVAGAMLHGYRNLGDEKYLAAARAAVEFLLKDLHVFHENDREKCIAYMPRMDATLKVININALAGALTAGVGRETGEKYLLDQAEKLMNFVAAQQTDYGAWYYTTDPRQSLVNHDNYHTGMILDAFMEYMDAANDRRFQRILRDGLVFYRERLFMANGAPRWTSDADYPYDVHGSSQGTLTFALAGDLATALHIAGWGIDNFYKENGEFSYQIGRIIKKKFTLLHWCNGWMARALAALVKAGTLRNVPGDK